MTASSSGSGGSLGLFTVFFVLLINILRNIRKRGKTIIKTFVSIFIIALVVNAWAGTVLITWTAPSMREDGSVLSLSEIAGYRAYYGTTAGDYQTQVDINDPTATEYTLADLSPGTYYIVLTTLDTDGRESLYSTEIVVIISALSSPRSVTNMILKIGIP